MKDLLIVSTYGKEGVKDWWQIQREFVARNTENYDFGVFLHNVEDESPFEGHKIIGRKFDPLLFALPEMFHEIYHYFRRHRYKNYLLLDSDCFPVKPGWLDCILKLMGDRWYAAPVRTENLDTTPHPCALFVRGEHVGKHLFYFRRPSVGRVTNLLGEEIQDIGTGFKTEVGGGQVFFPLLRSNHLNVHPVLAAVYGDLFYHHGGGSRRTKEGQEPYFRSTFYWDKIVPHRYEAGLDAYERLAKNPRRFVNKLRGGEINKTCHQAQQLSRRQRRRKATTS